MGYYIRVLTPESNPASPALLEKAARAHGASVTGDLGAAAWDQLVVTNSADQEVCAIERNVVSAGSLAEEELAEFRAETAACLELSEEAVRTRLHRARALLREELLERAGLASAQAFRFERLRCDRVVAGVVARLGLSFLSAAAGARCPRRCRRDRSPRSCFGAR